MKKHLVKVFEFTGVDRYLVPPAFGEPTIPVRWWGDCPRWAAEVRRSRPDLAETVTTTVVLSMGPGRSPCPGCLHGGH